MLNSITCRVSTFSTLLILLLLFEGASTFSNCNALEVMISSFNSKELDMLPAWRMCQLPQAHSTTKFAFQGSSSLSSRYHRKGVFLSSSASMNSGHPAEGDATAMNYRLLQNILRLRGPVASGYGRGGKQLGIPTANLPESLFADALASLQPGVYFGWAMIEGSGGDEVKQGRNVSQKAVVNVGYSPTFEGKENREKIVEAHLIVVEGDVEIIGDFYNETMRLSLLGTLRPEKKFASFPELLAAIHFDIKCAAEALLMEPFLDFRTESFLCCNNTKLTPWVGADGGNTIASWEYEHMPDSLC